MNKDKYGSYEVVIDKVFSGELIGYESIQTNGLYYHNASCISSNGNLLIIDSEIFKTAVLQKKL